MKAKTFLWCILLTAVLLLPLCTVSAQTALVEDGQTYHFMNCDTGRTLGADGVEEFVLTASGGENEYAITDPASGKYLDFSGGVTKLTTSVRTVVLEKGQYERFRIFVDGRALYDSDAGQTNVATVLPGAAQSTAISACWYLTKSGDTRPLKIMPLGDSITYGVNPDIGGSNAYRKELSEAAIDYFGRVVFVGDQKALSAMDDKSLLRHSGYPGYVVEDKWYNASHPGVLPLLPGLTGKYAPDVVLLMLGTNDSAMMVMHTDLALQEQMDRYKNFVGVIEETLSDNGLVICASIPPSTNGSRLTSFAEKYAALIEEWVAQHQAQGGKVAFADNFAAVSEYGEAALSSDGVHLNAVGDTQVFKSYYAVLTNYYGSDSLRKEPQVISGSESLGDNSGSGSSGTTQEEPNNNTLLIVIIVGCVIVAAVAALLVFRTKNSKNKTKTDSQTESEGE